MRILTKTKEFVANPLYAFKALQAILAVVCICIPLVFRFADRDAYYPPFAFKENHKIYEATISQILKKEIEVGTRKDLCGGIVVTNVVEKICKDRLGFRESLSDYAYSSNSYIFGLMYCVAAMMFLFNGVVQLNQEAAMQLHPAGSWVHIIIGLSLIGVVLSPERSSTFFHNLFTILFFGGNIISLGFLPNKNESTRSKRVRVITALFIVIVVPVLIWEKFLSILEAEWVSLTLIAIHLFLVAIKGTRSLTFLMIKKEV